MTEPLLHDPVAPDVIALDARFGPLSALVTRLQDLPVEKLLVYLVDAVDAQLLPELGRQFHVTGIEGWHLANTDEARRALVKRSIALHRKKGTPWALKEALKTSGIDASVTEWWQQAPAGAPFTFTVDVAAGQVAARDPDAFDAVQRHVDEWKPASRHASYRIVGSAMAGAIVAAAGVALAQWQGSGELQSLPQRGETNHAAAASGHGFMLLAGGGNLH